MSQKHHILLFGGTGLCGQLFMREALDVGHQLTLYARTPSKLPSELADNINVKIIEGTYDDKAGLANAAACGADTFISFAGPTLGRREGTPISDAFKIFFPQILAINPNIRILVLSTPSYSAPQDRWSIKWFFAINGFVRVVGGDSYREIRGIAEQTVHLGDEVDWTVFRVPLLYGTPLHVAESDPGAVEKQSLTSRCTKRYKEAAGRSSAHSDVHNITRQDPGESRDHVVDVSVSTVSTSVKAVFVGDPTWSDGLLLDRRKLAAWVLAELDQPRWTRLCPLVADF